MERNTRKNGIVIGVFEPEIASQQPLFDALRDAGYQVEILWDMQRNDLQGTEIVKPDIFFADVFELPPELKMFMRECQSGAAVVPLIGTSSAFIGSVGIERAFDMGAWEYVEKPYRPVDVVSRVGNVVKRLREVRLQRRERAQLVDRLTEQKRDLVEARRLQREFSAPPRVTVDPMDLASFLNPSSEVGGDLFNCIRLNDRYTAFYMLDVAGHGIASALFSMAIGSWLQAEAHNRLFDELNRIRYPSEVVSDLNSYFPMDEAGTRYFTMTYGVFDALDWSITFTRAGHTPLVVIDANGVTMNDEGDPPVGVSPMTVFTDITIQLEKDATVFLYSDGLVDQLSAAGDRYGDDRMIKLLSEIAFDDVAGMINRLRLDLVRFAGGVRSTDDVSLMAMNFCVDRDEFSASSSAKVRQTRTLFKVQMPATLASASAISGAIGALSSELFEERVATELRLAAMEAMANVVRHGYKGQYDGTQTIDVTLRDDGERLSVELIDKAPMFDPVREIARSELMSLDDFTEFDETPHLGLSLVSRSVDEWHYERRGDRNCLILAKVRGTSTGWYHG